MARVLFVFAHQDDEMAAISRIRYVRARGDDVACVYLTDGAARVPSHVRDAESRAVLQQLGVSDVRFHKIADGTLPEHLDEALTCLTPCDEVVTLAWEGGHQDHDAAFLVASVFAKQNGIRCWELPLYNGEGTRFYRVQHPIGDGWQSRPLPRREKLANMLLCRHYKSQRSTWLGLLPLMLLRPAREFIREADPRRAENRPHPGRLLYERRFHYPYDRFAQFAKAFLREAARD